MPGRELSYEETLAELQSLIGRDVVVLVSHPGTRFTAATINGPLNRAAEIDRGADSGFPGESMIFFVNEPDSRDLVGTFGLWRDGFQSGYRLEMPDGQRAIVVQVAEIEIRVMTPPGL